VIIDHALSALFIAGLGAAATAVPAAAGVLVIVAAAWAVRSVDWGRFPARRQADRQG
jgi:hypothetical protein